MSEDLRVSRATIREALRSLSSLRLVDLGAGRRTRAAPIDDAALLPVIEHGASAERIPIRQVRDARRTIEVRTAALRRRDPGAVGILGHARAMERAFEDVGTTMEHDIALRHAIARAARNPVFALIVGAFEGAARRTWPVGWRSRADPAERRRVVALHVELAGAVEARDPRAAAERMDAHFDLGVRAPVAAGIG